MASAGLPEITLERFPRGMVRNGPREAIPADGAYNLENLWLDEVGKPNRRGGSVYKTPAFTSSGSRFFILFDAYFSVAGGFRTVFTSDVNGGTLHVLSGDDVTVLNITTWLQSRLAKPALVGSDLVLPRSDALMLLYAGSRKSTNYTAGSVTVTQGSRVLTGSGTLWQANVDAGMFFQRTGSGQVYEVQSVDANNSITLDRPWEEAGASGSAYTITPYYAVSASSTRVPVVNPKVCAVANRLAFTAGNQVGFSDVNDTFTYTTGNFIEFGGQAVGLAQSRETLLVFTSGGLYAVSGLAYNQPLSPSNEPQWRRELVNRELIAWTHEGIAEWQDAVVVPCLDGVWLVDPISGPKRLSESMTDLYRSYVNTSGYKTGVAAVSDGHYLLPVLDGSDLFVDMLDMRLDTGAWVHHSGVGARMALLAARKTNPPVLLAATENTGVRATATRLYTLSYYRPSAAVKTDHDGSNFTHVLETGDIEPPGDQPVEWKQVRVWQEGSTDSGSPTVSVSVQRPSDGAPIALTGASTGSGTVSATVSAINDGSSYSWWAGGVKRGKRIRVRLTGTGPLSSWVLHKMAVLFRQGGRS